MSEDTTQHPVKAKACIGFTYLLALKIRAYARNNSMTTSRAIDTIVREQLKDNGIDGVNFHERPKRWGHRIRRWNINTFFTSETRELVAKYRNGHPTSLFIRGIVSAFFRTDRDNAQIVEIITEGGRA